ncbi:hypothetical protein CAEBREN_16465 [Caenorhabditis brenneri]|uniref:F-box domain-containing protein n=1 Tax=Caenorhabditis brenneri TaxID=135651 RepID=G0N3P2_CAEBE|nr:hypothetical protein CAEBREN_16465 [Caenorhabditis brenneri]
MSSLALVPFTFPVLKLPFVALQVVADCLNPFEIYHFSRISKKTNKLAKVFSRTAVRIYLSSPFFVCIRFNWKENWSFKPTIEPGPDSYTVYSDIKEPTRSHRAYRFFSKQPASEVSKVVEWVMDVFKNSSVYLNFNTRSSRQDLISYFNWSMVTPSEVPFVSLHCDHGTDIQFFLENYKRPTEKLSLTINPENIVNIAQFLREERLELPNHLEINLFKKVKICNNKRVGLNLYNVFSCPTIDSIESKLTNQELNTLLKNWQLGLTNPNWKSLCFTIFGRVNLKDVLDGITATYRDPRTVKRQINVDKESCWIFGGIDIQKHDGTATATIQWMKYKVENEDSEVPNKLILEYERNRESGEVQHIVEQQDGIMEPLFVLETFSMYIW